MARRADRVGAMLGQPLADGQIAVDRVVLQRGDIGQRRRRRHAQQVVEDELAPDHRRGARRVRRDHQNARLAQQAAASGVFVEIDASEAAAVHVRDAVVLREPFVHVGVVRVQQIERAAILAQDALEEQLRLLLERLTEVVVEVGEEAHVRRDRFEIPEMQPLRREVGDERARTAVDEHPLHLPLEHGGLVEFARDCRVEQLVVGDAAPEEERQPRRELEIRDAVWRVRREPGRILLHAEQELRTHQDARQRHLDAGVESVGRRFGARLLVQIERTLYVAVGDRPAVGPPHERRQDFSCRALFVVGTGRLRDEEPPPRRRVARSLRAVRPDDRNRINGWLDARMPV